MDEDYYHTFTKGTLQPVLDNVQIVHKSGIHYELSNLVVTDLTNNVENYDKMIDFILNKLSPEIPIHFTRFHPDYKYTKVGRTTVEDVVAARDRALERGIKYAYIGNAFHEDATNTYCPQCKALLIERYGLHTYLKDNLNLDGTCKKCGCVTGIIDINQDDDNKDLDI